MAVQNDLRSRLLKVCWESVQVGCTVTEACYYAANLIADDDGQEEAVAQDLLSDIRRYEDIFGKGSFKKIQVW